MQLMINVKRDYVAQRFVERRVSARPLELKLDPDIRDSTTFRCSDGCEQIRDQTLKIRKAIGWSTQHNDCDFEAWEILLERKVSIDGDEDVKIVRSESKEFPRSLRLSIPSRGLS